MIRKPLKKLVFLSGARARPSLGVGAVIATLSALGCHDISRFDTGNGGPYYGAMVSTPSFQDGFLPDQVPKSLCLSLTLDTSKLTSQPGVVSSDDAAGGLCSSQQEPLFKNAPLRAIPQVQNDVLSTLEFGEGHEHDFFAWLDSTCQGTALSVVSLMKNGEVEVRLFKPAPLPPADANAAQRPGFALFHLRRELQGCRF
jgi:hypothetical protein